MYDFSETLKTLRTEKNISQEKLAAKLDISPAAIQQWEKKTRRPSIDMVITLARFFNVTVGQMAGTEDL